MIHRSCGTRLARHLAVVAIAGLALTGCPGRLANPERFPARGGSDASGPSGDGGSAAGEVPAMLATSCGVGAACHNATTPALGLDLASPGVADRIRTGVAASCGDRPLFDAADPASSYLIEKVTSDTPECGARMPYAAPPLSQAQQDALIAWVEAL